jgi:hypothetical protein
MVYNTVTPADSSLTPGLVAWENDAWRKMAVEIPNTSTGGGLKRKSYLPSAISITSNATLNFGTITIPEDGDYAFVLRFRGTTSAQKSVTVRVYSNGTSVVDETPLRIDAQTVMSVLAGTCTAGSNITVYITEGGASTWNLTTQTSMLIWKL